MALSRSPLKFFLVQRTEETDVSCDVHGVPRVPLPRAVGQLLKRVLRQELRTRSAHQHQSPTQDLVRQLGLHLTRLPEQAAAEHRKNRDDC